MRVAADDFALHRRFSTIGTTFSPLWCGGARQRGFFWGEGIGLAENGRESCCFWGFSCKNGALAAQDVSIELFCFVFTVKIGIFAQ